MSTKESNEIMDLEDRDPNSLSEHLQVSWSDIFGEPESIRSPECAWSFSSQCFKISRNCCYICLSVICAPLTAFCMGITFACCAFKHIWCVTPCFKVWKISCAATRNFVTGCTHAIVMPCTEAIGYVFSEIKVKTQQLPDGPDKKRDPLIV